MAVVGNITGGLPVEMWVSVARHISIQSQGRMICVCRALQEIFDGSLMWKFRAKTMLTDFITEPIGGWKAWVKKPPIIEFEEGSVDLFNGRVYMPPANVVGEVSLAIFAVDVTPLLKKIPGKLICYFCLPMGHGRVWYRDEEENLIKVEDGTDEWEQYRIRSKDPTYRRLDLSLTFKN